MGTSGSTPLHFAAANGNSDVVTLLLLHGAHADRADKHGITPEMLAQQNGWVESVKVLNNWILNKDQDLRDREGYDGRPGSSTGVHTHDQEPSHSADTVSSFSSRKCLTVKQSIDTALNKLKYVDSQSRMAHSSITSSPPSPPPRPFGEYSFYPTDTADLSANLPTDSTVRRPSLPHVLQVHSNEHIQVHDRDSSLSDSLPKSPNQRRPRSAGTGSDQTPEQEVSFPVYGRGGYGRKLGSKYSLLNLFKKAQPGEASGSNGNLPEANSSRDSPDDSLSITQSHLGQVSNTNLNENPNLTSAPRPGFPHRGSDASNKSTRLVPQAHSVTSSTSPMTRKASGSLQTPPRSNIPLALELLAQQQPRIRHAVSGTPNDVPRTVLDADERGKPSSPLARFTPIHSGHNRGGASVTSLDSTTQDNNAVTTSDTTLELESGKPSPSPRPGILRAYNRSSSSGQGSTSNPRTLRFDPSSSNDRKVRDKTTDSPILKSCDSSGSPSKLNVQTNGVNEQEPRATLVNVSELDHEDNYGVPISDTDIGSSLDKTLNVPSVLLQRQRGLSFASSSESSLSPILTGDNAADPNMAAINADFPFSINRPPSIATVDHEGPSSPRGLLSPVSADTRIRGDSLSSDSSNSNPQLSFTSGSGTSQSVSTPGNASVFPQDGDKTTSFIHDEVLEPVQDNKGGLNERRAHAPLDIDITSISSHAEAEALVERARREALDWASTPDFSPPPSGTGRSQLSARLAAYGESLALERKLREQKEQGESTWKNVQSRNAPGLVLPPLTSIPVLKGSDGVERQLSLEDKPSVERTRRHKEPRRPSTADGGTLKIFKISYIFALTSTFIVQSPISESNSMGPLASHHPSYSTSATKHDHDIQNYPFLQRTSNAETRSDFSQPLTSRTLAPPEESLSRISSFDGGTDTEPESPLFLVSTPPPSNIVRGKREVRTANKLMRMGYPANEQTTSRASPPSPPTSRFAVIKSLFKGKT